MLPSSPRHALLALAVSTAGFLAPWVLGGFSDVTPQVQATAELPPLRVAHVVLPQQALDVHADAKPTGEADPDATDTVDEDTVKQPVADRPPENKTQLAGTTSMAIPIGEGPVLARDITFDPGNASATTQKAERKKNKPGRKRKARKKKECLPDRDDVAQVADHAFRIEDATVHHYANHPREAETLAATWWSKDDDDSINGFKVGRLQCGSLLETLGFKNGDVISKVNGMEIKTYGDAINAYMTLRRKRILWVDVTRRGEPVRLDFVLVGEGEAGLELAEDDPLRNPSALVDEELAAEELPWLRRVVKKRKLRRMTK